MRDVTASVGIRRGVQCRNRVVDQQTVLGLLDQIPAGQGGNAGIDLEWMPPREGFCQEDLHQAIRAFQRANQAEVRFVDGHVDPGLATIRALNRLAEQAASSASGPLQRPLRQGYRRVGRAHTTARAAVAVHPGSDRTLLPVAARRTPDRTGPIRLTRSAWMVACLTASPCRDGVEAAGTDLAPMVWRPSPWTGVAY